MFVVLALHVVLSFQESPATGFAVVRAAVAEAAAIWAPYGVTIDHAATTCERTDDAALMVAVDVGGGATRRHVPIVLGAIVFAPDGIPEPRITMYLEDVVRFVATAKVLGASEGRWPKDLREQVIGRALGRVLAHEIGHYLMRSPAHTAAGLMRPRQLPDELAATSRTGFGLSAAEVARLSDPREREKAGTFGRPW